jgi:fused signal recognition particle receptor
LIDAHAEEEDPELRISSSEFREVAEEIVSAIADSARVEDEREIDTPSNVVEADATPEVAPEPEPDPDPNSNPEPQADPEPE